MNKVLKDHHYRRIGILLALVSATVAYWALALGVGMLLATLPSGGG